MNKNFKLVNSQNLNVIPLCSPVQLLEIERLSTDSYGISPSIMVELCASNLSQLITTNILGGSTRLSKRRIITYHHWFYCLLVVVDVVAVLLPQAVI